jgi:hypothetical protein
MVTQKEAPFVKQQLQKKKVVEFNYCGVFLEQWIKKV